MTSEALSTLAASIALELCAITARPWEPTRGPNDWKDDIAGPDGARLCLHERDRRLHISGDCSIPGARYGAYNYLPHGQSLPSISVAPTRSPYDIARDIVTRLLPDYARVRPIVSEAVRQEQRREATAQSAARLLARTYGDEKAYREPGSCRGSDPIIYIDGGKATVHVWGDEGIQVNIDARVGLDKARRIMQILGELGE